MKRKPHILYIVFCLCFIGTGAFHTARAQQAGIKTNLLYWATTTPNIGLEWRLAPRYTLSATVGYNAFNFPNRTDANGVAANPKLHHWLVMPEAKYWFCRVFERHYIGFHALYGQ